MDILQLTVGLFVIVFALCIGSFLNVVILRLPDEERSIVNPPSHCPNCGYQLHWYDNIPILSYILLGGKCRGCSDAISIQYPLVELTTAALAMACYVKFGLSWALLFYFFFCAALLAITFIDIPYQIIPNEISLPGILIGIGASFITGQVSWFDSLMGAIIGFSLIAIIAYGYYFLTGREGMGMGDAKLLAMLGAFLGWQSIPFILLAASLQGLAVALFSIGVGWMPKAPPLPDPKDVKPEEDHTVEEEVPLRLAAVPFGPFLSLAALEFLFFGNLILDLIRIRF